ncbi:MAG: DUF899 domain-containing protein [Alphaproteobacteria bacterium]|nr:DUF899 domain-containing protein [Alphaproteobacteria bacterium]
MAPARIATREEWLKARLDLLEQEKAFTRQRDQLNRKRRELPMVAVDKDYVFEGPDGKETLADLFGPCSQLIVQHFMYGKGWSEGCPSCSFWADGFDGTTIHMRHRDASFVAASNAPLDEIEAYKQRMGWRFKWVSSYGTDFNRDYHVTFTKEEMEAGPVYYNYKQTSFPVEEAPGISIFYKDDKGGVFHTYSCYARGLDMLNTAYHYIDLLPKGRDEDGLPYTMSWLRRHDQYED